MIFIDGTSMLMRDFISFVIKNHLLIFWGQNAKQKKTFKRLTSKATNIFIEAQTH